MKSLAPFLRNLMIASVVACISLGAYAEKIELKGVLSAASEVPPKDSKGNGTVTVTLDTGTDVILYTVTFADLSGPAVAAHFHGPAMAGENAKPQIPIKASPIVSPIDGTAHLTADQAKDLLAGKWYFNIHTAQNPAGEVRAQIEK